MKVDREWHFFARDALVLKPNQLANLQSRDAFIAGLEAEFANWGKDKQQGLKKS